LEGKQPASGVLKFMARLHHLNEFANFETIKSASKPPVNRRKNEVETKKVSLGQKILNELTLWRWALQIETRGADRFDQK
jgi:hypothetical protein